MIPFQAANSASIALIGWRGDRLRSPGAIDSPLSREGAFLANNVLFAAFAFVVLLGTVFPLIVEALNDDRPADHWKPSTKEYSGRLRRPEYPGHFEIRRVSACGAFRLQSGQYFLSNALKGEDIGMEEIDDGIWNIVYYNTILGRIDRKTGRITGQDKV